MGGFFQNIGRILDLTATTVSYKQRVAHLFGISRKEIGTLYAELYASEFFRGIKGRVSVSPIRYYLSMVSPFRAPLLYVACRILRPERVVETGVKDGFSSSFTLFALEMNKKGQLYSIDLPNTKGQELESDKDTGWLVPAGLKGRWQLAFGTSRDILPGLLHDLGAINLFFHDSDHSYENMMFEFNESWKYLRPGGYLLSDDITDNGAFDEFIKENSCAASARLFKTGLAQR